MRFAGGTIAIMVIALLVFHAGVVFGMRHTAHSRHGMGHGFRSPFFLGRFALPHDFISNTHGAVGTVSAVTLPTLTMETREGTSQTILISTSTIIRHWGEGTSTETISVGNQIVVLGEPNGQGRINAKIIRILSAVSPTP